jgi:uncharacterized membrane protein YtjA (UPF0391 family)
MPESGEYFQREKYKIYNYNKTGETMDLIYLAVVFMVLALVAFVLGARGVAGFSMQIAKWLVIIFVVLAVVVFLFGGRIL